MKQLTGFNWKFMGGLCASIALAMALHAQATASGITVVATSREGAAEANGSLADSDSIYVHV